MNHKEKIKHYPLDATSKIDSASSLSIGNNTTSNSHNCNKSNLTQQLVQSKFHQNQYKEHQQPHGSGSIITSQIITTTEEEFER